MESKQKREIKAKPPRLAFTTGEKIVTKKKLGLLLIIMGIMLIAVALSLNYYNYFHEKQSNKRMEAVLSDLKTQISDSSEDSDSSSPFDIFDDSRSTDSEIDDPDKDIVLDGNSYIGLISFPTLGQEFPVTRGWSYAAMNTAACQYSGRRVDNDLIICAHNYTGFFDKLDKLSSGDQVIFTDVYGREFNYTVTNSELLSGWDSPSLIKGGGSDWDLTLFTCTWSGYSRVTVRLVYS